MNAFFPVGSISQAATASSVTVALPTGGPVIRISRQTSADAVYIKFGTSNVTATVDGMELVSGIVEELENPNPAIYTHFAVVTTSGIVTVNISTGPRYRIP